MKHAITVVLLLLAAFLVASFRRHVYANRTSTGEGYIGFGWVVFESNLCGTSAFLGVSAVDSFVR